MVHEFGIYSLVYITVCTVMATAERFKATRTTYFVR